jgi:hypothetical protein
MGVGGEGAKFWMSVLTDLRNRGVRDVFFLVCDGLKGLPDVVEHVWPQTVVRTCIIHLVRNTFRLACRADHDALKKDLRAIYTAPTADAAEFALEELEEKWGQKYRAIIRLWRNAWNEFIPFLDYDVEIRRVICSTGADSSWVAPSPRPGRTAGRVVVVAVRGALSRERVVMLRHAALAQPPNQVTRAGGGPADRRPEMLPGRLGLVVAPAGWGKSALLASWFAQHPTRDRCGWFSADDADNDPGRPARTTSPATSVKLAGTLARDARYRGGPEVRVVGRTAVPRAIDPRGAAGRTRRTAPAPVRSAPL